MELNKKNFTSEVLQNGNLSLVQFRKEWNGASQIIAPLYDKLADSYKGQVNFFTVDADEENALTGDFGISDIPTILFFKNGQLVDHAVGLTPKNELVEKIEKAMSGAEQ